MSQSYTPKITFVHAAELPAAWLSDVRAILVRDGQACRAGDYFGPPAPGEFVGSDPIFVIEVQSINTGIWHLLNLPSNAARFATAADRDAVLAMLVGDQLIA